MVQLDAKLSLVSYEFLALLLHADLGKCSWLFALDFWRVTICAGPENVLFGCPLVPISIRLAWRSTFYLQQALLRHQRAIHRRINRINSLFRSLPSLFLKRCLYKTLPIICIKVKNLLQFSWRSWRWKLQSVLLGDFWLPCISDSDWWWSSLLIVDWLLKLGDFSLSKNLMSLIKTLWHSVSQSFGIVNWHRLLCFLLLNQ